ncbi:putative domain KxDL [Trinorchestia longiramus]|nr:putative domain KxDL [Trinorchestia longiramus]
MAGATVGSEGDCFECWENYSAGEVMVQGLAGQIHQQDVESIVRAQKQMLQRFEKTNEMLSNCNALSASRYAAAQQEFSKHTSMLLQAKKDLDYIFKKIRSIKSKLEMQYPQAVKAVAEKLREEDELDLEEEGEDALKKQSSTPSSHSTECSTSQASHVCSSAPSSKPLLQETSAVEADASCGDGGSRDSEVRSCSGSSRSGDVTCDKNATGGELSHNPEVDEDYHEAILSGKVKTVSGKLHHVSSSDSSTSSTKSSSSSDS